MSPKRSQARPRPPDRYVEGQRVIFVGESDQHIKKGMGGVITCRRHPCVDPRRSFPGGTALDEIFAVIVGLVNPSYNYHIQFDGLDGEASCGEDLLMPAAYDGEAPMKWDDPGSVWKPKEKQ